MKHAIPTLLLALGTALPLSGCGFTPLHTQPSGTATFEQLDISVSDGRDENDRAAGFALRQHMLDRTGGANPAAPYRLEIVPDVRRVGLGLTDLDRASRFDSVMRARWTLTESRTGRIVERGLLDGRASFSADRDPYRLLSTDQAAVDRVTRSVADDILVAVAVALAGQPAAAP